MVFVRLIVVSSVFHRVGDIFAAGPVEDGLQSGRVAVGDEDLPEGLVGDQADELLDPSGVEFVEQIVEQQQRLLALFPRHDGILRQLEGHEKRFLLPLRTVFAQGVSADLEHQIVAVDARRGEFIDKVFLPGGGENLGKGSVVEFRAVGQFDLLAVARERAVVVGHNGAQPFDELRRRAWIASPCSTSWRS